MATFLRILRTTTHRRASLPSIFNRGFVTSSPPPPLSPSKPSSEVLSTGVAQIVDEDDFLEEDDDVSTSFVTLPSLLQPRVIIYDGVCHLCHGGVKWVIKADKDRKIKFCCLQSEAAEPYMRLCDVDREDVLRRFLFIEGPGLYHQGSTAALKVLSYLPLPYSALSSLLIISTPLREAVYDYVANNRYHWFGKSNDCLVLQEKVLLHRFIDREELIYRHPSDL